MTLSRQNRPTDICLCLLFILLSLTFLKTRAQDITVAFTPTTPTTGTAVRFIAVAGGTVPRPSISDLPLEPTVSDDHKYVLSVDTQSYRRDKNHRFTLDVYLTVNPGDQVGPLYKFSVWEDPIGAFPDSLADVTAQISGRAGPDTITVRLPQHSDDSPNLQFSPPEKPYPVSMGSDGSITLGIKNILANLHIEALTDDPKVNVATDKCPQCWAKLSARVVRPRLAPGASTSLIVDLQPNTLEILKHNFLPTAADAEQQRLTVTVTTVSEDGGVGSPQDFSVPIRFTPPPVYLALFLVFGAVIGVVMRSLLADQQKTPFSWPGAFFQLLLALVVWMLVLVLFVAKTKATIFGYELDPTALIPAGLITVLAAGGPTIVSKISEIFKR